MLTTHQIENRLIARLHKDRTTRSRTVTTIDQTGTTITVAVSNDAYGLAIGIGARTGEDPMQVIDRLGNEPATAEVSA